MTLHRQNWRTVRTRDTGLLQALPPSRAKFASTATMGTTGPGKGGFAGQERGGAGDAAGTSTEPGTGSAHHTRCGAHADCEWECDGVGYWACAEERDRSGHGTLEAAVEG